MPCNSLQDCCKICNLFNAAIKPLKGEKMNTIIAYKVIACEIKIDNFNNVYVFLKVDSVNVPIEMEKYIIEDGAKEYSIFHIPVN